jgi:hypothetical protein
VSRTTSGHRRSSNASSAAGAPCSIL